MKTKAQTTKAQNLNHLPGLALLALILLLKTSVLAQSWQTVDDVQYVLGQSAVNFGLVVAPSGTLFAAGYASDGSVDHGLVMASTDGGNTWSAPIDDFSSPGITVRDDGGITADAAGNLYVAGRYYSSGPFYRFVRRSTDGGATWSTVDTVTINGFYASPLAAGALAADSAGNVYVTEPVSGTWSIRKGIAGTSFSTVDTFQPSSSQAEAVFAHPIAGVFAVGYSTITSRKTSSQAWTVRRSADGGLTWATVDIYQASSGFTATVYGAGSDAQGNIYVVGRAFVPNKTTAIGHWQVRKSSDGGASWLTVDDYEPFTSGNQVALGFAADATGNLFVSGWVTSPTGPSWVVRESLGGAGPWTTVDTISGIPRAIAAAPSGNVFVGGQGTGQNGGADWIVRKN